MKKISAIAGLLGLIGFAAIALAQTVPVPLVQSIGQTDLVQVIPKGAPQAGNVYAYAGQVAGVEQYSYQIPVTAFSITVPNAVSLLYLNPAGTLATGTMTMQASPADGQKFCVEDTQTQTAITVAANTGQSMLTSIGLGAVTALTANTRYCWFYNGPLAGWIRTI